MKYKPYNLKDKIKQIHLKKWNSSMNIVSNKILCVNEFVKQLTINTYKENTQTKNYQMIFS